MNIDDKYYQVISENLNNTIQDTNIHVKNKQVGKVRDAYFLDDKVLMVSTDRQSAFDRVLARIPYKGVVLNLVSAWWFKKTKDMFPNHLISTPNKIPSGLKKNQKLSQPMLTPTTKDKIHDRPVSKGEILALGLMTEEDYDRAAQMSLDLFNYGQDIAAKNGLILVDTKYELGKDSSGNIKFVDEIHTPDSSRYWIEKTYQSRFDNDEEPQNIDKEFLRLWFAKHCDPYNDKVLPEAPDELIVELSARYILLYELITGEKFDFPDLTNIDQRIKNNIKGLI